MRRPSGWYDAAGVVTDEDEGKSYYVSIRYYVNPGSRGDRTTPDEPPFVDDIRLVSVEEIDGQTDSKEATNVRQAVTTDLWHQVEALAERALEDEQSQ